ncbi:MAG TPA: ABC transporter permease [Caldithrix abyssi]|uniref:ABC transporter permease n=1 Tax=Caldithrix abyssi TaxID=187145 RepID=A0A7V4WVS2_CALAY|nr:ABC transporter permease [Caldithrix abyssi]
MKNLFRIARWEFVTRFRSRSFMFNTIVSPLLFTTVIMLPLLFFEHQPEQSTKLVGIIDLSGENIARDLQKELNRYYRLNNTSPEYMVLNVSVNNSEPYQEKLGEFREIQARRDSINQLYNQIKQQRTRYYQNTKLPNRTYLLQSSYKKLQQVREEKELVDIELSRFRTALDSVYKFEAQKMADSLIVSGVLNSYLIFDTDFKETGIIHYNSNNPGDFLDTARLEKILQAIIIKKRILGDNVERSKAAHWLRPIKLKKFRVQGGVQREWDFYIQFYGPLIGVFLLFMAIFTASGYIFSSVLMEKNNRVIEVLLSYATSQQLMGGKILGLGLLGLVQIFIWIVITLALAGANIIPVQKIDYLTINNALYFMLYFSLGFLFYGAIFITVGSVSANEYDAQQINQLLRTVAIFPALLSLMVLTEPNSLLIRILSYIPFLTPSFMIMRIPLSTTPITEDIYITTLIMFASIAVLMYLSGRIFRVATLMQGKKPTWSEIMRWVRAG